MARPREFDEIEALDSAVETFRDKGYEAASLMDLLKAMDLSKSSLYNSFGTKHELFLAAIDHYAKKSADRLSKRLSSSFSPREGIRKALEGIVDDIMESGDRRGCLLHNSAIEVLPQDPEAAQHIERGVNRMKDVFTQTVRDGQRRGEIMGERDPEEIASYLTMSQMGLRSVGRVTNERRQLDQMVDCVMKAV